MHTARLLTTPKQALVWLLIIAALAFFLQMSFLPAVSFLGVGIVLFPIVILLAIALGGILPAFFGMVLLLIASKVVYGNGGLWLAVYLLPMAVAFAVCLELRVPFFKTASIVLITFVLSMMVVFIVFQREAGGNLYDALAKEAIAGLERFPARDNLLYTFWRGGLLSHGQEPGSQLFESTQYGGWTFKPEVIAEFYKQINARVTMLSASLLPGLLTSYSITTAFAGSGLALKLASRYDTAPNLDLPSFSKWFIPKSLGRRLAVLALGYLLTILSANPVIRIAGQMMYNVFFALYAIQGLSYLNFMMKRRGIRPFVRFILLLLLFIILSPVTMMMGVYDQVMDPRKLRVEQDSIQPYQQ
ncbi:MAG: DUF2232 domain-containing protein [Clostridiales bacterium]|nr:DUF2232 domain-containing protein [Clostridiales bacterium]